MIRLPKFGFIGYGSMGSMLVKKLIQSAEIKQEDIIITRKNIDKLPEIQKLWPEVVVTQDITDVVQNSKYIFLCMKPLEYLGVIKEIKPLLTEEHHIISITGSLMINDIERLLPCKITRLLPTLTSEVLEGITLVCHNSQVQEKDALELESNFHSFTRLFRVKEDDYGFASEFTSCGPGLYAAMLQEFVEAGLRHSNSLTKEQVVELVMQTIYGTAKLMLENEMDFEQVITRVATKGGITEEGVRVLKEGLPNVFDEVFECTMGKRRAVEKNLHEQFLEG
jgi:pyrroline-5-carboxylate reductase